MTELADVLYCDLRTGRFEETEKSIRMKVRSLYNVGKGMRLILTDADFVKGYTGDLLHVRETYLAVQLSREVVYRGALIKGIAR